MERTARIELASSGWKPEAQPLYHACVNLSVAVRTHKNTLVQFLLQNFPATFITTGGCEVFVFRFDMMKVKGRKTTIVPTADTLSATVGEGFGAKLLVLDSHSIIITNGTSWKFAGAVSFHYSVNLAIIGHKEPPYDP